MNQDSKHDLRGNQCSSLDRRQGFPFLRLIYNSLSNFDIIQRYFRKTLLSFQSIPYNEVKEEMGKEWGETMRRERKQREKQRWWTKILTVGLIGTFLCGCAAQSAQEGPAPSPTSTTDVPMPTLVPTPIPDMETLLPQLLKDRGLIQALNSTIYEFSHEYELVIHDKEWVFTDAKGKGNIIVNLTDSEITFAFSDVTLEYKKKDRIVKTAVFSAELTMALEGSESSWNAEIVTEDDQHFVIQFDPKTAEIQDGEAGSETLGQKMNFAPSLYGQCLSFFKRYWNQSIDQRMIIKAMVVTATKLERGIDPDNITIRVDKTPENPVNVLEPNGVTPEITLEVEMNFNDKDTIYLKNTSKLEKTLYLFTAMDQGFDDPSAIDWEALAPTLMSAIPKYGCDGRYCLNAEGQVRFADYAIREGYGSLVTQPDMNKAAKVLSGQDYVYDDYDNRKLSSGVVYSQSVNSYIAYSREGDWLEASPGVMVLDQKQSDNRITVDFVTYVPQWEDKLIVEGIPVENDNGQRNANPKVIQTVKDNLDRMPHWTAELEDTGDDQFYRLLWAVRY